VTQGTHTEKDRLAWEQVAWDSKGNVIDKRTTSVSSDDARHQVDEYVEFLKSKGADLRGSVLSQIERNKVMIDSLMREVRGTRTPEEVQPLRQSLNQVVELSKELESVYRMMSVPPLVGTIRIHRLDQSADLTEGTYFTMFAPYRGPGGALPTRSFTGRQALTDFLIRELHIDEPVVAEAWDEISSKRTASILNVLLSYYELVRAGLV
jgi:hypothetical protein